ncbi:hypothetical protein QTP88_021236 [Uroleucon formosanum]
MPMKPHKWGYKLFILAGVSGFAHNIEIYSGQENDPQYRLTNEPDLGASANIVDLLKMSLNNSDIRSQSKQIVYNVYTFLKELSSKPDLTADFFKQAQIHTGEACGLSERTVRRICSEAKHSEDKPDESNTEGLKVPTGKGGRLIVCHAGCARYGFIQGSKLVFRSNAGNTADYHSQMNAEIFQKWFVELLNNLEELSVIVMDNASYHSTLVENYPKSNWRKADVQKWLTVKNIEFSPLETLPELHQKIKGLMPREKQYLLDQISLENEHEVIRLPPYHCQYNPIELIWTQVKSQGAKNNHTFKMVDIERLTHEALDAVTKEDWEKCVRHTEQLQELDNQKEILRDTLMEPIILTILPNDSDASDEESDTEELE